MRVAGQSQAPAQWERSASLVVAACKRPPGQSQGAAHGWGRPSQAGAPFCPAGRQNPQTLEIWGGQPAGECHHTKMPCNTKGRPSDLQCLLAPCWGRLARWPSRSRMNCRLMSRHAHDCHIFGLARHACCGRFQTTFIPVGDGHRHVAKAALGAQRQTVWPEWSAMGAGLPWRESRKADLEANGERGHETIEQQTARVADMSSITQCRRHGPG